MPSLSMPPGARKGGRKTRSQKEKNDEELAAQQRLEEEKANLEAEKQQQTESDNAARAAGVRKGANEGEDVKMGEEADKLRRVADKKHRAAERAREEAEASAASEGSHADISVVDEPDADINNHLNELNTGGDGGNDPGMAMEEEDVDDDMTCTPVRKKKKSSKSDKRKERKSARKGKDSTEKSSLRKGKKRDEPSKDKGEDPIEETGGSALRSTLRKGKKATVSAKPPHDHKFKREYVQGSVILSQDGDRHTEFTMKLRGLLKEGQKVDEHLAIMPVKEGMTTPILTTPNEIPLNQTDLGTNVNVDSRATFEKKRPWGKDSADVPEEDWPNPEVWFSIVLSSDLPTEEILDRVRHEWRKNGGNRLQIKELKTHHPEGAIVLYHLYNQGSEDSIVSEGVRILTKARDEESKDTTIDNFDFKWADTNIPEFSLALNVPNIPGQDSSKLNKMSWQMKNQRKAYHMVCDKSHTKQLQELVAIAKNRNLIAPIWGKQVKASNAIAKGFGKRDKTPSWQIQNIKSFTKHHVNFHASMTAVGFDGIWDLDKEVAIYNVTNPLRVEGWMCLRTVMYSKLKLGDGHPLLAEIHQKQAMGDVEAVVPDIEEAEMKVAMINKNVVAYLSNYLVDVGMPADFVTELLKASCDPSLFHNVRQCTWDKETKVLTTPEDEEKAKEEAMQKAAWYKDDFGSFMDITQQQKGGGLNHVDPEHIYDLDGTHSVKSIRERPGKGNKYGGSPGAPAFKVGRDKTTQQDGIDDDNSDEEEETNLAALSRDELITRLQNATISGKHKGSAPDSETNKSHSNSEEGEGSTNDVSSDESDSKSVSSSSSGSSAESNESMGGAPSG